MKKILLSIILFTSGHLVATVNDDLLEAAKNNDTMLVRSLLTNPEINVNFKKPDSFTPLMYAARNGNATMVKDLLIAHANPGIRSSGTKMGRTALTVAKEYKLQPYRDRTGKIKPTAADYDAVIELLSKH